MPTKKKSTTKKKWYDNKVWVVVLMVIIALAFFLLGSLYGGSRQTGVVADGNWICKCRPATHHPRKVVHRTPRTVVITSAPAQVEKAPCATCGRDVWNPDADDSRQPKQGEVSPRGY
jgi:hypothetical protein